MATPYYTKQPVYIEDPSGRFSTYLDRMMYEGPRSQIRQKHSQGLTFLLLLQYQ